MFADNLFGSCHEFLSEKSTPKIYATKTLERILMLTLKGLLDLGYGWSDDYTQCIVGGVIKAYEDSLTPDLIHCDEEEKRRLYNLKHAGLVPL